MITAAKTSYSLYRALFIAAAAYNIVFAVWSGFFPRQFFTMFATEPPGSQASWRVTAVVVALFGLIYAYAAYRPTRADIPVAVGLASKVLGPFAWLLAVTRGEMSPQLFPVLLLGDLLWWFPLLTYLLRRSAWRRAAIAWICVALHLAACVGLLVIAPGTEMAEEPAARQQFVLQATAAWTATWFAWTLSSVSLLAFVVVWSARMNELAPVKVWTYMACAVIAVGLVFDLCGEIVMISVATRAELSVAEFERATRTYQLFGPAVANGLYCLAGIALSGIAWRIGWLKGTVGIGGFVMWSVGLLLTVAAIIESRWTMVVTGAALMLLFIPWAAVVGWKLRCADTSTA